MLLLFTVLYLALNVFIGFWAAKKVKTASDFAVAGRGLTVLVASTSIFATWFGAETVMSSSGLFAKEGTSSIIRDPFGAALCLILIGLVIARPMYKLGVVTFSDYLRVRYGRPLELISALLLTYSYLSWIAGQLLAMGNILHEMTADYSFALPVWAGVAVGASIIALYTCVGGMWAVSWTDFMQAGVILTGLILLLSSLLYATGGISPVINAQPEGFFSILPKASDATLGVTLQEWLVYISYWLAIGISFGQQDVLQRVMSTKSASSAARSSVIAGIMYITIAMFPLLIGICGHYLYPDLLAGDGRDNAHEGLILRIVQHHSGLFLNILFFGALTSAIMSTASGAILAPATVITQNLIRPLVPHFTDKQMLAALRIAVLAITVLSAMFAMEGKSIYELNTDSATILLVTFTVPIVLGIYWQRASLAAAMSAMVGGFIGWWLWIMYAEGYPPELGLFTGFGTSLTLGILVSLIMPNKNLLPLQHKPFDDLEKDTDLAGNTDVAKLND